MIINWETWNEEECKEAWKKLREDHSAIEILYALRGGMSVGDIKLSGSIGGLTRFDATETVFVDIDFEEPDEVCETWIDYKPEIPVSKIKVIADSYRFDEKQKKDHEGIFSEGDDLTNIRAEFRLECIEE